MARPWDRLPPKDQLRLQEALLRVQLRRYVYPFSPFYRRLYDERGIRVDRLHGLRDIQELPLVSRDDFAPMPDDAWRPFRALLRPDEGGLKRWAHRSVLRRVARERLLHGDLAAERVLAEEFKPVHLHLSPDGGPVIGYTMRDLSALSQAGARSLAVLGARRADVLASALPYGPALPFWHVHYAAQGAGMAALHLGAGGVVRPARAAHWMHRAAATILVAHPGYAEGFLRGAPPATFAGLRILALWAAGGMAGARERFAGRLRGAGAPDAVVSTLLGVPEARAAWAECPSPAEEAGSSTGYHTYPDLEYLEVVDPETGIVLGDGRGGELVYTSLDWRGSALVRYRTGVLARAGLTREPCPGCGRTVPRILPDVSYLAWRVRPEGAPGERPVDLADALPALWSRAPLWQVEVVRGAGRGGADLATGYVAGISEGEAESLRRDLAPSGIRCRRVGLRDLGQRIGVGRESAESRVVIRDGDRPARGPLVP